MQHPAGQGFRQGKLGRHGDKAQRPRRDHQSRNGAGHAAAPGKALGGQAGGGNVHARRRQGHEHHIHRQDELIQAHALAADAGRHKHPESHAQHPQHQPGHGKDRRIFQINPDLHL